MCDKTSFSDLRDRVTDLEKGAARFDEQIKTLFYTTRCLLYVTVTFGLIMLLAIVYGAIGQRGFNAVTNAAAQHQLPNP